jgi:hypothetical protein
MVQVNSLCSLGNWITQKKQTQLEVSSASQQEDKTNNDLPPHCVVTPGSSISHDLNIPMKYPSNLNILDENYLRNRMQ